MPLFRPGKPRITVYTLAAQAFVAAGTTVTWTASEHGDGDPIWPGPTPAEVEVDRSGFFLVTATAWLAAVAGNRIVRAAILRSGDELAGVTAFRQPSAWSLSLAAVAMCSAGDTITLELAAVTGAAPNTLDAAQPRSAVMSVIRVSPKRWT